MPAKDAANGFSAFGNIQKSTTEKILYFVNLA